MIITMPLLMAGLQIGGGLASTLLKEDNPELARNIETLVGGFTAGAQGMSSLAGAFGSPSTGTGLGIADSKSYEAFEKNPEGIFGGGLKEGATFGEGINKLPGWNAPESIFNFNPGKTEPFDWSLFK